MLKVINQGKYLYDTAYDLNQRQKQEYGEQYGATDDFYEARKKAYEKYMEFLSLARIDFKRESDIVTAA